MKLAVSTDAGRTYSVHVPWWLLAAALVIGLSWQPASAWASDRFSDVPDSNIFHDDIAWMAETGVTAGCDADSFCPDDDLTRAQMSAFLRRLDSKDVFTTFAEVESMVSDDAEVDSRLAAVEARLDELEAVLDGVSRNGDLLTFAGMNVRVVDGSGDTAGVVNGLGNLIVGYDENPNGYPRSGSHNLVVGRNHEYSSYAGLVAGEGNRLQSSGTSVTGGQGNIASGTLASVSGGRFNTASGFTSSVSGGLNRTAPGSQDWAAGSLSEDQ